jgi:K+-sensing histidine kinase KdpD
MHPDMRDYVEGLAWVAAAALLGAATHSWLTITDQVMLHLVAVVIAGARLPPRASLLAAVAAVASVDFLFVAPYYTFAVHNTRFLLTFAVMLAAGVVVSRLMGRLREEALLRAQIDTEKLRNELLSAVSHDLRTPLASIQGAATALLDDPRLGPEQRRELLSTVREESERLGRLVTDLLDLTRLESGALRVTPEPWPVEELVTSASDRVPAAHVRVEVPDRDLTAPMDPTLMQQVLVNLLENAAKFSPPGADVDVRAWAEGAALHLEVADRGPGIPPGEETRIFEKFYRAADGERAGGTGLGLAICRAIVSAHGGRITASNREGGGARVEVQLPLGAA